MSEIKKDDEVSFRYADVVTGDQCVGRGRVFVVNGDQVKIDVYPEPNSDLEEITTSIVDAQVRVLN